MTEKLDVVYEFDKIASDLIKKWGEDEKTIDLSRKLNDFVFQIKDDNSHIRTILIELIKNYNYYTRENVTRILKYFYNEIENNLKLNKDYTIYSRIEKNAKIDSSNNLLEEFKTINSISNSFSHDISKLSITDMDYIKNVIFIDDIIGSGHTVKNFLEEHKEKLLKVKIVIFCVAILDKGAAFLHSYCKESNLECKIIPYDKFPPAFQENHIFAEDAQANEEIFKSFELDILEGKSHFILGYENSQALVSFFRNTPNNTLSTFWLQQENWNALFPRNDDKPIFMRRNRTKRGKQGNPVGYNIRKQEKKIMEDDFHETLILIYLNDYKDKYMYSEMKELCNFTNSQLRECIKSMIHKNLLINKGEKILLTDYAWGILEERNLENVSIDELFQETVTLNFIKKADFNTIYIPKNFKK